MNETSPPNNELLPPDRIRGYARSAAEELQNGKGLAHVNMAKHGYPLITSLADHVEALWEAIDEIQDGNNDPWIPKPVGEGTLSLINDLVALLTPEQLTEALKVRVAGVVAAIAELTSDEEEGTPDE
jgi:hypothetical protein